MSLHDRINDWLSSAASGPEDSELERQIVEITRVNGKILAIQEYQRQTKASSKKAKNQVEYILYRHHHESVIPFRVTLWQRFTRKWRVWLVLFVVPAFVGLLVACCLRRVMLDWLE